MNKRIIAILLFLLILAPGASPGFGQESSEPLSKSEILQLLRQSQSTPLTQGDIAAEVDRRGVDFQADDQTLRQLEQAGAHSFLLRAIVRAAKFASEPHPPSPELLGVADANARAEALARLPLLEQARFHALEYVNDLPNFIVTQMVTRSVRTAGQRDWVRQDVLEIALTYRMGHGEEFKLLRINGAPSRLTYEQVGGSTSTGELGSLLGALFVPQSKTEFKEAGREKLRNRETVIYDFKVRTPNSRSEITDSNSGRTIISGYQGSVWIDIEKGHVLRVELSHDDIPPGFPITVAENSVDYDWVTIAGERYLLPIHAEVLLGSDRASYYSRNVIEFRNYRRFEAELRVVPDE